MRDDHKLLSSDGVSQPVVTVAVTPQQPKVTNMVDSSLAVFGLSAEVEEPEQSETPADDGIEP